MTIEQVDPPRIEDEGARALRELVRSRRQGPSTAAIEKMSERLAAAGVMPTAASSATRLVKASASHPKLGLFAVLVSGALVVVASGSIYASAASAARSTVAPAEARATSQAAVAAPPPGSAAKVDAISVDELPSAGPAPEPGSIPSPPVSDSRRTAKGPGDGRGLPPAARELELVQRAEAILPSDPARALEIAREHARAFPSGEFLQEREVIAVDALSRLGRKEESLRRARALVSRFPRTPYAARLELAIGQSLTPPSKRGDSEPNAD